MKQKFYNLLLIFVLVFFSLCSVLAQRVSETKAKEVATSFLKQNKSQNTIFTDFLSIKNNENLIVAYLYKLQPQGYIVVSAMQEITPVVAFSFIENIDNEGRFISLLKTDLNYRFNNIPNLPEDFKNKNRKEWFNIENNKSDYCKIETWPKQGQTTTGGWVVTKWNQSSPYNTMIPKNTSNQRCLAGCPAIAMGQIVYYHKFTGNTEFTDEDDYYHSFSGLNFSIDDDFAARAFPSFPQLNDYLDTINYRWSNNTTITSNERAALIFACGTASTQVYSTDVSGVFFIQQVINAYHKFGYDEIRTLDRTDSTVWEQVADNIKEGLPAHLSVVDSNYTTGHNVVIDGYRSDGYFHVNFGWGGSADGWYILPNDMPYGLTCLDTVVLDIKPENWVGLTDTKNTIAEISVYPNPTHNILNINITNIEKQESEIILYNIQGKEIFNLKTNDVENSLNLNNFNEEIFILKVINKQSVYTTKVLKMK